MMPSARTSQALEASLVLSTALSEGDIFQIPFSRVEKRVPVDTDTLNP